LTQTTYALASFIDSDPDDAGVPHRYLAGFRTSIANLGASSLCRPRVSRRTHLERGLVDSTTAL